MPPAVAIPAIASVIATGSTAYGSHKAGQSARRAQNIQSVADERAEADLRAQRAEDQRRWDIDQAQKKEDVDRQRRLDDEREARQAPYRAASAAALGRLGELLGLPFTAGPSTPTAGVVTPQQGMTAAPPVGRPLDSTGRPTANDGWGHSWQPQAGPLDAMPATETPFAPVNAPGTLGAYVRPRRQSMRYA